MMEETVWAVGAAWSVARGWLTPAVLFVAINLVIATIAVASRLMPSSSSAAPGGGDDDEAAAGERWGLLQRAPSFLAVDRLRSSFSFSRLGLAAAPDHAQQVPVQQPLSGDDGAAPAEPEPSLQQQRRPAAEASQKLETEHQRAETRVERSRSEAAAEARNNRRRAAAEELELDGHAYGGEAAAAVVEVDARADDFIRKFREQLRLQRLDSILRYRDRDSLRRTGTA